MRELVEKLMGGLPAAATVERQGRADPIQEWEAHGIAPHSAAAGRPAAGIPPFLETDTEAPDAVQLSLALDEAAPAGVARGPVPR